LQMINNRLRPTALPDPKEVEDYYKDTFVPEYAKSIRDRRRRSMKFGTRSGTFW